MSHDNSEAGIKFCSFDFEIQANADFYLNFILRFECLKTLFQIIFKVPMLPSRFMLFACYIHAKGLAIIFTRCNDFFCAFSTLI